ncbi:hypothetical protein CP03DC29_1112B, partial [Chlamydia psittaci 03DC29]
ATLPYVWTSF